MLDKIRGKDKNNKNTPDLRSNNTKKNNGRLTGMVGKVAGGNNAPPERKMPRPMPKPSEKSRLKPPQDRPGMNGFGRRVPDDDNRTLIGAAVFGVILIILVGAGYYFAVYAPYQGTLDDAKKAKLSEINTYFKGPLATDPQGVNMRAQVESAVTPDQVNAIDVIGPATTSWRTYQNQQIKSEKDPYGRIMITYTAGGQKSVITRVAAAYKIVNRADATVLANMQIKTPDTVAIPIIVSRLQAAGGLINVGNSVDIYLMNTSSPSDQNSSNQTVTSTSGTPQISGAAVLAILRAKDSGAINANKTHAQTIAIGNLIDGSSRSEAAQEDVEQLIRAVSARNWDEGEVSNYLNAYGWRLSDFERTSNLGELDAQYLLLLEVPRENAIFLIQNMNNVILTVPTQKAPNWMIRELAQIYG